MDINLPVQVNEAKPIIIKALDKWKENLIALSIVAHGKDAEPFTQMVLSPSTSWSVNECLKFILPQTRSLKKYQGIILDLCQGIKGIKLSIFSSLEQGTPNTWVAGCNKDSDWDKDAKQEGQWWEEMVANNHKATQNPEGWSTFYF